MISHDLPEPIRTIADHDDMFEGNIEHYFEVGRSAMWNIVNVLNIAQASAPKAILDLPSGSGRVLRYLKAKFPEAAIVACDAVPNHVDFCQRTFGVKGVVSKRDTHPVMIAERFDLIWCGSLLTHVDRDEWNVLLSYLVDHLADFGVLVFTTHGRRCAEWLETGRVSYGLPSEAISKLVAAYRATGFAYADYSFTPGYGISVSAPSRVASIVEQYAGVKLSYVLERGWDQHQDVVGCVKYPEGDA